MYEAVKEITGDLIKKRYIKNEKKFKILKIFRLGGFAFFLNVMCYRFYSWLLKRNVWSTSLTTTARKLNGRTRSNC
mgnify:CR=1 FL=1